jgi:carbon monoxide dehydrogenase subunit G
MITFEKNIYIDRPPQVVFDYMSDPKKDSEWRSGSDFAEWITDDPVGVGSKMRSVNSFMGRKVEAVAEITSWDPPHHYSFKSIGGSFPSEFRFSLRPEGSGTQLISSGEIAFSRILKVLEWLFGGQIKKGAEGDFERLKLNLEDGE